MDSKNDLCSLRYTPDSLYGCNSTHQLHQFHCVIWQAPKPIFTLTIRFWWFVFRECMQIFIQVLVAPTKFNWGDREIERHDIKWSLDTKYLNSHMTPYEQHIILSQYSTSGIISGAVMAIGWRRYYFIPTTKIRKHGLVMKSPNVPIR